MLENLDALVVHVLTMYITLKPIMLQKYVGYIHIDNLFNMACPLLLRFSFTLIFYFKGIYIGCMIKFLYEFESKYTCCEY